MSALILALIPLALIASLLATWLARSIGRKLNAMDGAGVAGQVKAPPRRVPNIGGVGIFLGFAVPLATLLLVAKGAIIDPNNWSLLPASLADYRAGLAAKTPDAWIILAAAFVLHLLGLIDDRRPLGPFIKLFILAGVSLAALLATQTRMFTMLDAPLGGTWASYVLTLLWVLVVTNALNFLDNMDGLSAGIAAIAGACFLAIALLAGQWFVAAMLALLVGSLLGFLWFNKPLASIFMGDGGSLVIGFLLAFLSVRITYSHTHIGAMTWHAVFTPLVVLAVPLYDFTTVVLLRLSQGKSPFVGDLQHVSHRLVNRGLSKPLAVVSLWGFTGVVGLAGVLLPAATALQATLIATQVALLLIVLAIIEFAAAPGNRQP
jgi:UDP-GlcNAc:undecaprenyl-phosphate/decaprenyl-phosphate GlcNAc-1-phosphate transferase